MKKEVKINFEIMEELAKNLSQFYNSVILAWIIETKNKAQRLKKDDRLIEYYELGEAIRYISVELEEFININKQENILNETKSLNIIKKILFLLNNIIKSEDKSYIKPFNYNNSENAEQNQILGKEFGEDFTVWYHYSLEPSKDELNALNTILAGFIKVKDNFLTCVENFDKNLKKCELALENVLYPYTKDFIQNTIEEIKKINKKSDNYCEFLNQVNESISAVKCIIDEVECKVKESKRINSDNKSHQTR